MLSLTPYFALTRATGSGSSSIFDHGYLLQRACLLTECDCVVRRFPASWRRVCVLVSKSSAKFLATLLVSVGDFFRGCCTSDVASFSTSDGNQGIAAMPYKFMPRAQSQGTAILAAAAPGLSTACKSDDSGSWHNPKNSVPFSMSHTPLHNLYCTPLHLSKLIDSTLCATAQQP